MYGVGFFLVMAGVWFADCAYHGRPPILTMEQILKDPSHMRAILDNSKHTNTAVQTQTVTAPPPKVHVSKQAHATGNLHDFNTASAIVQFAEAQVGKPYKWAHTGPDAYDCSGLVYAAYKSVGITIPRTSYLQLAGGRLVKRKDLQPGDLIFPLSRVGTPDPGHVYLYAGGGQAVEAANPSVGVHMTAVYRFWTARRYL